MVYTLPIDRRTHWTHAHLQSQVALDLGTSKSVAIKQKKIEYHHMLANSLSDVVADEASKRLLPDLNHEQRAERCDQIGTSVAKRLALVQADMRVKREEAGEFHEVAPVQELEVVTMQFSIERLMKELGKSGHTLERHRSGLKCRNCRVV